MHAIRFIFPLISLYSALVHGEHQYDRKVSLEQQPEANKKSKIANSTVKDIIDEFSNSGAIITLMEDNHMADVFDITVLNFLPELATEISNIQSDLNAVNAQIEEAVRAKFVNRDKTFNEAKLKAELKDKEQAYATVKSALADVFQAQFLDDIKSLQLRGALCMVYRMILNEFWKSPMEVAAAQAKIGRHFLSPVPNANGFMGLIKPADYCHCPRRATLKSFLSLVRPTNDSAAQVLEDLIRRSLKGTRYHRDSTKHSNGSALARQFGQRVTDASSADGEGILAALNEVLRLKDM